MKLVILGPPGAGKGTQASLLRDRYGLLWWSMGDMLRSAATADTDVGREIERVIANGDLVSDDIVGRLVAESLSDLGSGRGFILDGFPRNLAQAEVLDSLLRSRGMHLDAVVEIKVDRDALAGRITGRYFCTQCMEGYHDVFRQPKSVGICDNCGGTRFDRRVDDDLVMAMRRLEIYSERTEPVISYYAARGILFSIDGQGAIDEVSARIDAIFSKRV